MAEPIGKSVVSAGDGVWDRPESLTPTPWVPESSVLSPDLATEQIEAEIREFLVNNFIFDPSVELDGKDSLMENGIVDSTGILEVLMWVESNFGVHVEDSEVLPENFDSIGNMTRYVKSKVQSRKSKVVPV